MRKRYGVLLRDWPDGDGDGELQLVSMVRSDPLTLTLSPKGRGDDYALAPLGTGPG
ncbi:hypothetical protein NIHE141904_26960 [Enterobacter hormaechei]|nr:hypothetical protein NIHE141904_26960 [Enterobacter hormaechei]